MRIAYIAAGAGGMYCGSCIHDNALAAALQKLGHDVALLPTYTPLRTDEENVSEGRLFYGALNVYLQHRSGLFRHTPRFLDRLLDRRRLLGWVSRLGASTDPRGLGDLTLDVLRGEAGSQSKELDKLVEWLANSYRPDLVQITNSMLLGLVRRLKQELDVPVVVALQGEDLFLDQLPEPQQGRVVEELRRRADDADLFVAPSRDYARRMAKRLGQDESRVEVVPFGIKLDGHGATVEQARSVDGTDRPVTIGYLARICPEKGLHRLVDAFIELATEESTTKPLRLRIAGYLGPRDRHYLEQQQERLRRAGLADDVDVVGEIDRDDKIDFLSSLDLLSVPTVYEEPKGLFALEAMANGVPVVLPGHGSFPEMIDDTGGGVIFDADSPEDLVEALRRLVKDPEQRRALGERGKAAVHSRRGAETMATATLEVYRELLSSRGEKKRMSTEPISTFRTRRRVEFADTDLAGLVHFARFFVFMETAEHELLRSLGTEVHRRWQGRDIGWPRVDANCRYLRAARFAELLDITVKIERKGEKSMTYGFDFERDGELVAVGRLTAVCCRLDGPEGLRSIPIPADIAERLVEYRPVE